MLALRQTGDLSMVYPTSCPMTAGIGSDHPATLHWTSECAFAIVGPCCFVEVVRFYSLSVYNKEQGLCGAIGQRVRLLTERMVVRAHPGTAVFGIAVDLY